MLSREEIRELLSPLSGGEGGEQDSVLLLTERPEEAEDFARLLAKHGISLAMASSRFSALDFFRARHYRAVFASVQSLGVEAAAFISRLREIDPEVRYAFLCDEPGTAPTAPGVTMLQRPVRAAEVQTFLGLSEPAVSASEMSGQVAADASAKAGARRETAIEGGVEVGRVAPVDMEESRPTAPTSRESVGAVPIAARATSQESSRPAPEVSRAAELVSRSAAANVTSASVANGQALLALRALLESQIAGESLEAAMVRWSRLDPGVVGVVLLELDRSDGLKCRVVADDPARRREILALVAQEIDELSLQETPDAVQASGPFLIFGDSSRPRTFVGVLLCEGRDEAASVVSSRISAELVQLLPLIKGVSPQGLAARRGRTDNTQGRKGFFLEVLAQRLSAAERERLPLGLLVIESAQGRSITQWIAATRAATRSADWVESWCGRLYVIVDRPGDGTLEHVVRRLREIQELDHLRIVAATLSAGKVESQVLLDQVEAALDAAVMGPGVAFVDLR
ncbi:MAG: hypothetical protein ACKVX7_03425 [Planctomycetota bacterium]